MICALAAMVVALGCNKTQDSGYEGTNYIYLSSESGTMYESLSTPYLVDVMLTSSAKSDIELNFELEGTSGVLEIQGLPLTIKAGEREAQFSIVSKQDGVLSAPEIFTVKLASNGGKLELAKSVSIPVYPGKAIELTDAQKKMIEAYKTKTNIDLSKYIGLVPVTTKITTVNEETEKPVEYSLTGYTQISLGKSAADGNPVLKMDVNAMGLQTVLYNSLRVNTVAGEEWQDAESYPKRQDLMNVIGWNADINELLAVSLDNIRFDDNGNIDYLAEVLDKYEYEMITIVPFAYDFAPYTKELAAIEDGTFDSEDDYGATINPAYWLNCYDIADGDDFDEDIYHEAAVSIDENSMEFKFCYSNEIDSYGSYVIATYSPIKK